MNKKPFNPERKFEGDNKPFKKSFDKKDGAGFRKPFEGGSEGKKFKKPFEQQSDRGFRKSFEGQSDKPFKKKFDQAGQRDDDRGSFKKSFDKREDRPYKKPFDKEGNSGFKRKFDGEDKPFKKRFDRDDKPGGFKRKFDGEDKPFKKRFDRTEGSGDGFKRKFDSEDKPFKMRFDSDDKPGGFKRKFDSDDKSGGFKRKFDGEDKPFKKRFDKKPESPFRRTWGAANDEQDNRKPNFRKDNTSDKPYRKAGADNDEPKKPNRYANAFGKLDDEELLAQKAKAAQRQIEKENTPEVTFSKELEDKWTEERVEKDFGKSQIRPRKEDADSEDGRERHSKKKRFKRQFDNENEYEQVYTAAPGKKEEMPTDEEHSDQMPLNKFIAHCDVCSRRDAVVLIKEGKVTVNDELVTVPGHKVTPGDVVKLNGEILTVQKNLVYILMNKPKGFITTTEDPKGRRTVMEMVAPHIEERVFPVGRLDRNTTGLLLLTNDGELAQKLAHPKYTIRKVYKATLDKNLSKDDFEKIKAGVILEDGPAPVDELEYLDSKNEIGLEIHSGKNRIVRRIFESLGYEVEKLDRVMYAGLTKKNILRGRWRFLTKQEVINLKHIQ